MESSIGTCTLVRVVIDLAIVILLIVGVLILVKSIG